MGWRLCSTAKKPAIVENTQENALSLVLLLILIFTIP